MNNQYTGNRNRMYYSNSPQGPAQQGMNAQGPAPQGMDPQRSEQQNKPRKRRKRKKRRRVPFWCWAIPMMILSFGAGFLLGRSDLGRSRNSSETIAAVDSNESQTAVVETEAEEVTIPSTEETTEEETTVEESTETEAELTEVEEVYWSDDWTYAENSKVHQESILLYHADSSVRKGIVICVNAGHGSVAAQQVKTLCHPDGSAKVTGGSTAAGSLKAVGASSGTDMADGSSEGAANLTMALMFKEMLLEEGYDVLMIREESDCDLDNIARTLYANAYADCHIAIHYDSSDTDKGFFYIGVPDISSYRSMEPVASHWEGHEALGSALIDGVREEGVKIYDGGRMPLDLTQTSYSTVPSVDVEVGDKVSSRSEEVLQSKCRGMVNGLNQFFGEDIELDLEETITIEAETSYEE